jgi:hypothetical protein
MTLYTVLAPATKAGDTLPTDPMRVVFVKEGIAWPALFFGAIWLIVRRMWLVLAGYIVLAIVVGMIDMQIGGELPGIFMFLTHILLALEGNELRRWTLMRAGYRLVDVVEARNLEEAEIRYFAGIDGAAPIAVETAVLPIPPVPPAPPSVPGRLGPVVPSAEAGDVVGLFPAPQPPWGSRA